MPPEPDIKAPPPAVTAVAGRLEAALDQVPVPAKATRGNIIVGTWNLRAFADLTKDWHTSTRRDEEATRADEGLGVKYLCRISSAMCGSYFDDMNP